MRSSFTKVEQKLTKNQAVINKFISYISTPENKRETNKTFEELDRLGKEAAQELAGLTYEELMSGNCLTEQQKALIKIAVARSQEEMRQEYLSEEDNFESNEFLLAPPL